MSVEVEHLRQRAHALSRALFLRLEEYVEDFPTGVPPGLIELFKEVAREADNIIEATTDSERLALICYTLASVATYAMNLLDHANTAQTPRGLAQFLHRLRDNLQRESVLLVTPLAGYNYTIGNHFPALDELLSDTLIPEEKWKQRSKDYREGLNVVRFPRIERDNVLLHAIFGHEFGHPIADTFLDKDQESTEYQLEVAALNEKINAEFATDLSAKVGKVERLKLHGELCGIATAIRRRGLEELISDAVAVLLFGPSALFAAAEILVSDGLDNPPRPPEFYPPSRFRLRVMRKVLKDRGHLEAIARLHVDGTLVAQMSAVTKYVGYLEHLADSNDDRKALQDVPLARIAYEWIDKSLESGLNCAITTVGGISYPKETIESETPEALRRLDLGIPPSEIGIFPELKAVDWRTPILAGWMYKLYLCGRKDLNWIDRRDKIKDTQSLALRGIEDSLLRTEYLGKYPDALKLERKNT